MKKLDKKVLKLNKKVIANTKQNQIKGGFFTRFAGCVVTQDPTDTSAKICF